MDGNGAVQLSDIWNAVKKVTGCEVAHLQSAEVHEQMDGSTVWRGQVEVFKVAGHQLADRAYAWAWNDAGETRYHVVLNLPPITCARDAVQEAISRGAAR